MSGVSGCCQISARKKSRPPINFTCKLILLVQPVEQLLEIQFTLIKYLRKQNLHHVNEALPRQPS
ncbi:hypothetical protein NQ318_013248 [Aromia moschata]|uniref:Uncharacterized protein n=1 Tax=Aromia moschata TaxID=1265417 RepID=A0AAV8XST4_9CUCU|nr:hypothetical protein NQ318_013248 [Aromia moschata]